MPTDPELRMKRNRDKQFPSPNSNHRLGDKATLTALLAEFCKGRPEYEDVAALCSTLLGSEGDSNVKDAVDVVGFVYLVKNGKHHKIGRTTDVGRRAYDINLQLPEKSQLLHSFATDDPVGIERYWHDDSRTGERTENGFC